MAIMDWLPEKLTGVRWRLVACSSDIAQECPFLAQDETLFLRPH